MKNQKNYKNYSNIHNLRDLQRQKKILNTKLKIRKHFLNKHLKDLNDDFSADYVYRQSLRALKVENGLMNILPRIFINSSDGDKKNLLIRILSIIKAKISSLFSQKNSKDNNKQD